MTVCFSTAVGFIFVAPDYGAVPLSPLALSIATNASAANVCSLLLSSSLLGPYLTHRDLLDLLPY
jgi:hypothetical protein